MKKAKYLNIVSHYEKCFKKYGDSHLGVDWPNKKDAQTRYKIMLDIIDLNNNRKATLLDFGCGASHLFEYIKKNKLSAIKYSGLDISKKFIECSKKKFPTNTYYHLDILKNDKELGVYDYIILNGVFTEKHDLKFDEMFQFMKQILIKLFNKTKIGLAFNVMSSHVDWKRDDLFHLPLDTLAPFLINELSRNFIINNNYGLYEYTTYLYK
jgi:hypothetical protein